MLSHFKACAVAALLSLAAAAAASAQGFFPLPSAQGTDQVQAYRAGAPYNNSLTLNQIGNLLNQGDSTPRNVLLGGDFATNPLQRGTSNGSAHISNTLTYGPDGFWFLGGASSSIDWSQQTGASDIPAGFGASLRFQRTATTTDTTAVCMGQVLESGTSYRFQGQTAVISFYALKGGNFSPAASNVNVTVAQGTGSNQSAANFAAGTWTGYASRVLTPLQGSVTPAAGISQVITATWTRYSFSVPITSAATQVGFKICFTPVGTAGTNDWVELEGIQLETAPGAIASPFDYHLAATELNVSQRTLIVINEPAAGVGIASGFYDTGTTCIVTVSFPDTMRAAPTITFGGTALSATTWRSRIPGSNIAPSTPFLSAGTHTATNANLTVTTASQTTGTACQFQGAGGGSKIIVSAEL
jgi:hypothetical protein